MRYLKITLLFLLIILLVVFVPGLDGSYVKNAKLYINEVMVSNKYTIRDDDNEYSDYIELYNGYNYDLNLAGYSLSDSEYETDKWSFPEIIIKSKSYLIIYASGKDQVNLEGNSIHTNFRLSNLGEVLTLSDSEGNIISKITYPEMGPDISYGYSHGKYFLMEATPGTANVGKEYKKIVNDLTNKIIINEYMTDNQHTNYDSLGNYYDWIELYNSTTEDIVLRDVYLTDDVNKLNKFKLPEVLMESRSYLIIYLSGKEGLYGEEVHANFKLSTNEEIILSDGKNIYDQVTTVSLLENISYGLKGDKWYYFTSPTPGQSNNTKAFEKIGSDMNGGF